MFIAQHHRLPTRLLDWSTNALVALYFAAENARFRRGDGKKECEAFINNIHCSDGFAVFAIEPSEINRRTCSSFQPIDVAANVKEWERYINPSYQAELPICVNAPHMTSRIRSQSGVFTLHGSSIEALESHESLHSSITKIFIPFTATAQIKSTLIKLGITRSFIYPGLDSLSKDIAEEETLNHVEYLKEYTKCL